MNHLPLVVAALGFPCLLILVGVTHLLRRRRPPVPFKKIAAFLGLGLIAILLGEVWALFAERWLLGRWNIDFYYAFVTASIPEEGFRFLVILYGLRRRPHVGLVAAMLLGSLVGLTFGAYEHVGYALMKGWSVWLARSFTSVPYHVLSGAILGYAAAVVIRSRQTWGLIWPAVLVIVHGLADWPMLDPESKGPDGLEESFLTSGWAGNIGSLLVVVVISAVLVRKAIRAETDVSSEAS